MPEGAIACAAFRLFLLPEEKRKLFLKFRKDTLPSWLEASQEGEIEELVFCEFAAHRSLERITRLRLDREASTNALLAQLFSGRPQGEEFEGAVFFQKLNDRIIEAREAIEPISLNSLHLEGMPVLMRLTRLLGLRSTSIEASVRVEKRRGGLHWYTERYETLEDGLLFARTIFEGETHMPPESELRAAWVGVATVDGQRESRWHLPWPLIEAMIGDRERKQRLSLDGGDAIIPIDRLAWNSPQTLFKQGVLRLRHLSLAPSETRLRLLEEAERLIWRSFELEENPQLIEQAIDALIAARENARAYALAERALARTEETSLIGALFRAAPSIEAMERLWQKLAPEISAEERLFLATLSHKARDEGLSLSSIERARLVAQKRSPPPAPFLHRPSLSAHALADFLYLWACTQGPFESLTLRLEGKLAESAPFGHDAIGMRWAQSAFIAWLDVHRLQHLRRLGMFLAFELPERGRLHLGLFHPRHPMSAAFEVKEHRLQLLAVSHGSSLRSSAFHVLFQALSTLEEGQSVLRIQWPPALPLPSRELLCEASGSVLLCRASSPDALLPLACRLAQITQTKK
ncbi:MAG: hypothetical protein NZM37_10365 [Sandaracinaceae bacterium]|nr:hypothetical protein [Sandaracinaceae bacterium]